LTDPIEKYLPASVKEPEFKGHKITLEDLATHTSALPDLPSNIGVNNKLVE
jgi:D-alanyl-D-alanine-carboxypeptidase/D-alanyl-D-alanine-endopeptidase